MIRTCKFEPCGREFEPTDARQEFCDSTCRANNHYAEHPEKGRPVPGVPLQSVAAQPLADARAQQEGSDLKSKLSAVIYEGIVDRLKQGPVHADDLEHLFPDGCRDLCRRLVGAQFGSLASRHYIESTEYRKSKVPSRKGAKSWVYIFTKKGRARLAGVSTGATSPPGKSAVDSSSADSGEGERASSASRAGDGEPPASPGQPPAATTGAASPEPLKLVGDEVGRERPRSAITEPEAA